MPRRLIAAPHIEQPSPPPLFLLIDLNSKGGSIVVEASTVIQLVFVGRVSSVCPPKMVIAVRYNPTSPVEVRLVALVFSRQPSIPMRLVFFRIRKRSIRRGFLDLAKHNSPSNARLDG
jgi:hypothetical protein